MEKISVTGGKRLHGSITVGGMKNAALPILLGTILVGDKCVIENLPEISDIKAALDILSALGAKVKMLDRTTVEIDTAGVRPGTTPYELARSMRASYYVVGAELGRFGTSRAACPGGCDFGVRPIDQHIKGFEALGAKVEVVDGCIKCVAPEGLTGSSIYMDIVSVGATINIMLAAVMAKGLTVIDNAAKEPHIVDVANFLNTCGADISGAGTDVIKIRGVEELHGVTYAIIPDMIEAGTFMMAAAATGSDLTIENVIPKHLESITAKLEEMGVEIEDYGDAVRVKAVTEPLRRINVKTMPYPGYPTDMNPQICVLLCLAQGTSILTEGVWDTRFKYVEELTRMGAVITVDGRKAVIEGGKPLKPAAVKCSDLRAGAAMVIAALATEGETVIDNIYHIERGYEHLVEKLRGVGADIKKIYVPDGSNAQRVI
ncbi:MAG: UDP-N-acetylglucosamine 1-carboxyvinyltransferase [Ruminococcaceae bacterium]|nr:UDP-N-acetylglucosamine 1-carboxyvinyltransferase [Oscillospiraceae bacterium]